MYGGRLNARCARLSVRGVLPAIISMNCIETLVEYLELLQFRFKHKTTGNC